MNAQQIKAAQYLAMPAATRPTLDKIAEECGVTRQTIQNWKKRPEFIDEIKAQIIEDNLDTLPDLIKSLTQIAIEDRSAAMAKLALQVNGMLTDKVEVKGPANGATTDINELRARMEALKDRKIDAAKE